MRIIRTITAMISAAAFLSAPLPALCAAAEEAVPPETVRCGDFVGAKYDSYIEIIRYLPETPAESAELPAEMDGLPVTAVSSYAFAGSDVLTAVTVPAGVVQIGADAFADCPLLEQITVLNPECSFEGRQTDFSGTVAGFPESTAETYAEAYECTFASVSEELMFGGMEIDPALTELDLSGRQLSLEDLDTLRETVSQMPNLQKLILCNCGLSNETLQEFNESLPDIKVVWRLSLGCRWSLRTDAVAFSVLIYAYDYPRMTSNDIQVLKYCTDLRALDLGHQAITDLSVLGDYLPELRLLILADNAVSDLTPLTKMTHLHYLELFVNRLSDITPLAELHELVDVNVSYNAISDLTPLLYSPMMDRLWFEHTYAGEAAYYMLKQAYPNAKIVLYGAGSVDQGWRTHERYYQMMDMWANNYYGDTFSKYDDLAQELGLTAQLGDLNMDGTVTALDGLEILSDSAETIAGNASTLTAQQIYRADVDKDHTVSVADAQLVLLYYVANTLVKSDLTWQQIMAGKAV